MSYFLEKFNDRTECHAVVTDAIRAALTENSENHSPFGLIVPGGSTPVPMFRRLTTLAIDWSNVWITLTDERWVDSAHAASNENLLRKELLRTHVSDAAFIPMYTGHESPQQGEEQCHQQLTMMPWSNSICVLGMGNDGHIASLFPCADRLDRALDPDYDKLCIAQEPEPLPEHAPYKRISLTLSALLSVKRIILLIAGHEKWDTFFRIFDSDVVAEMPVRGIVYQSRTPVHVYWAP